MKLTIPELAVVALVGPTGSGKSSFARKHFRATEVLSSDFCRGLVSDEENSQAATNDAFEVLYFIASKRLTTGKLVVIDATNVQVEARKPIIALAQQLRRSLRNLQREGFRRVHILHSPEEVDAAEIVREPLWNNLKHEHGPFDIIGDLHGCFDELVELLTQLGYLVEKELVSVAAREMYAQPVKPLAAVADSGPSLTSQQVHDDLLDIDDVIGKRIVTTRLHHNVTVREENALAALEVMSRFAANPKWLIYLPPTMSPTETTEKPGLLEHPAEAFAYFRREGVPRVVCEEKHMGSRAVVIVCRDEDAARRRFGVVGEDIGICYTRTGRRFFDDRKIEKEYLEKVRGAVDAAGFWQQFQTDWICLDAELMPWSAKAQELLRQQYAAVGAAAKASLTETVASLEHLASKNGDALPLIEKYKQRLEATKLYIDSYRRYCWPVQSVSDLKPAPFHLLATKGQVHVQRDHVWHMEKLAEVCKASDGLLLATSYRQVDVTDTASVEEATRWWKELTERGGEGMVVKPLDFIVRGRRGLTQPAVKCRGPEYLRIIYGPEYLLPENLERLRSRSVSTNRSLALREFALGIEALERFVRQEPLRRVHECVFGVLALESEPVDPRL